MLRTPSIPMTGMVGIFARITQEKSPFWSLASFIALQGFDGREQPMYHSLWKLISHLKPQEADAKRMSDRLLIITMFG